MKILMVGDLHGNKSAGRRILEIAGDLKVDVIIQLGDFGYWPGQGDQFLSMMENELAKIGIELWFVDGNHENFNKLYEKKVNEDGRREISDHIFHLPRSYVWDWNGVKWMAFGGAASVDRLSRFTNISWFPQELILDKEVEDVSVVADIMVCHDVPIGVPKIRKFYNQDLPAWRRESFWPTGDLMRSDENQRKLRRIVEKVKPKILFHGHVHLRYSDILLADFGQVQIEGLGMDKDKEENLYLIVNEFGEIQNI